MKLTDGAWYTLPDGTLVQARVPYIGSVRLHTQDGTPAYIRDGAHDWKSLRYDPAIEGYAAAPCDLTDADLARAE